MYICSIILPDCQKSIYIKFVVASAEHANDLLANRLSCFFLGLFVRLTVLVMLFVLPVKIRMWFMQCAIAAAVFWFCLMENTRHKRHKCLCKWTYVWIGDSSSFDFLSVISPYNDFQPMLHNRKHTLSYLHWSYLPLVSSCNRVQLVPGKYLTYCMAMYTCIYVCVYVNVKNAQTETHTYVNVLFIFIYFIRLCHFASASINRRCVFTLQ